MRLAEQQPPKQEPRLPLDKKTKSAKLVKRSSRGVSKQTATLSEVVVQQDKAHAVKPSLFWFTLYFLYKNLYILGITIARRWLHFRRRAKRFALRLKGSFYAWLHRFTVRVSGLWRTLTVRAATPFRRVQEIYQKQLPIIQAQREAGEKWPIKAVQPILVVVGTFVWNVLRTVFNYLAPVVAVVLLITYVNDALNRPVALRLEYQSQVLGYVQNEAVFDEATRMVRERVMEEDTEGIPISIPSFVLEETDVDELLESDEIADMIIQLSGGEIETAYGLFIDDEFYGAVTDKDTILDEFTKIKEENETGLPEERVSFAKSIRFTEAVYPEDSVVDAEELIALMRGNETESETYVVQDGDTPTGIADKNGMRYAELLRLNPDIEETLKPGDELQTKVARPLLPVQITYVETYEEDIPYETVEVENSTYVKGYENVVQEGEDGLRRVVAEVTLLNGEEIGRVVIDDSEIIREPVDERIVIGIHDATISPSDDDDSSGEVDMTPSSASSSGFIWPTSGGRATTYAGHYGNAVDIALSGGGYPIYASRAGTVVKVVHGYTGYGNYVMIDHGDNYVTLYAHNRENLVTVGEYVEQGQVIATMGETGNATGNHVHFEIRYNGRFLNPHDYIGYSA